MNNTPYSNPPYYQPNPTTEGQIPPSYEYATTSPSVPPSQPGIDAYPTPMPYTQPYPNGSYPAQPVPSQTFYNQPPTVVTVESSHARRVNDGEDDILPSMLVFGLGWFGCCCLWLIGVMWLKSKSSTAKLFAWMSLIAYGCTSLLGIILFIVYMVIIASTVSATEDGSNGD